MTTLHLQFDGPVARISIDNAARRNAFSRAMWRQVPALVAQATANAGVRAVALQSAVPGCFAAGADISEFEATYTSEQESIRANEEIQAAVQAFADCPVPTLALIDGPCIGGGVALVLGCDMRFASDRATFAVTPARLGLSYHPDDVQRLYRACGRACASELLFSGQPWSAQRAVEAGLANRVLPANGFEEEAAALLSAICANSVDANRALKRSLDAVESGAPGARSGAEAEFIAMFAGRDFTEGRDAFLAKRRPVFPSHRTGTEGQL
jgi:enoyl-CoA hydratase/carnithine racemase